MTPLGPLDKVLHHLVTLRFPCLDPLSSLPALHVLTHRADVPLCPSYLFIFGHFFPEYTSRSVCACVCVASVFATAHCFCVFIDTDDLCVCVQSSPVT